MGKKRIIKFDDAGNQISTESTRIWAAKFLEDFRASGEEVYTFDCNLSNSDRGIIHQMSRKMGLISKSSGVGDNRRLSLYKGKATKSKKQSMNTKAKEKAKKSRNLKSVSFPPEANAILQELFTHYPPCDGDSAATSFNKYTGQWGKKGRFKDDFFLKPQFTGEEIQTKVASLSSKLSKDKALQEIFKVRARLPIASFRDAIISAVESSQVILISGETGCGKTTQVPQFLLDHMWSSKGENCKIICTQPRRISAMSVSERISCERGEGIGDNVGYKVRLQSTGGRNSSVVFCTNGILLRVLVGKGSGSCISDITHIIVDEIHERDCFSDFMLAIVRDLLPSNPHLRLILMSATLDAERFSGYFGGCPVVRVPGFTYPVKTFHLEDVLSILQSREDNHLVSANLSMTDVKHDLTDDDKIALDEAIILAWENDEFDSLLDLVSSKENHKFYNYQNPSTSLTPLMVFAGKGRISDVCMLLSFGADWTIKSKDGMTARELAETANHHEAAQIIKEHAENSQSGSQQAQQLLDKYMEKINPEQVDVSLIEHLMLKICGDSEDGAILVFLPGWDDINKTRQKLLDNPFFADSTIFDIICLHSMVPAAEQRRVFNRPPRGCRKIVLATNIAESAVTIDDVVYVVDSGRMKEKSYDPYNNVSTLQSSWVSKANAKQREGRAGRCQPGICYHLYSKLRASSMPEFKIPEIRRMPVEELCLQVKMLNPNCSTRDFLLKLMDPPLEQTIANALSLLKNIGALTPQEELTELGEKFGHLPVHPQISKMLFFAVLVNCLDPALTLACAADYKDPFTLPMTPIEKRKAAAAKRELASLYGGDSDQLAVVAAFECWRNAKTRGLSTNFCSQYFISLSTMKMLEKMRTQLQSELKRHGMIPDNVSTCSQNAHDPGILRAVLAVGLYPMVGRLCPSAGVNSRSVIETIGGARVRVHSLSTNFNLSARKYDGSLIVFDEITLGDGGMHIRNCTVTHPLPLLLVSTEIAVAATDSQDGSSDCEGEDNCNEDRVGVQKAMSSPENLVQVVVDRWLHFKTTALEVAQMYILRERLMASILFKVKHPREHLPPHLGASMHAISSIISYDGCADISPSLDSVEPLNSMKSNKGYEEKPSAFLSSLFWSMSLKENMIGNQANGRPQAVPKPIPKANQANGRPQAVPNPIPVANQANGSPQAVPNPIPTESASTPKQQKKKKKGKSKLANDSGLVNKTEDMKSKLANDSGLSNKTEDMESNLANDSGLSNKTEDMKPKLANDSGLSNKTEDMNSKLANDSSLSNKTEDMPSDDTNVIQQPNTAPTEAALLPKDQNSKKSKSKSSKKSNSSKKEEEPLLKRDPPKRQREDGAEEKEDA